MFFTYCSSTEYINVVNPFRFQYNTNPAFTINTSYSYNPIFGGSYNSPLSFTSGYLYENVQSYHPYYTYKNNKPRFIFNENYRYNTNNDIKNNKPEPPKANDTQPPKIDEIRPPKPPTSNEQTPPAEQKNNIRKEFLTTARKYSDCKETDNSHAKFCINPTCRSEDPLNQEWCTDFVTYVVKESYANKGLPVPYGFGTHDVRTLKNWAIDNNKFIATYDKTNKGKFIAENIKPGDIIILNENGASHTGFVTHVDSNGTISTIEGNRNDRVDVANYSPDYDQLSGFIRLT